MVQPATYAAQLAFMIGSMLCWGSWANTMKLTPGMKSQIFYWDYVLGLAVGTFAWGLTLGGGSAFLAQLTGAGWTAAGYAILAGIIFNAANQLLVAAIALAGLAVAFPVGIGLALVEGVVLNYILSPAGNLPLLASGVTLVLLAIVVDALAYRRRDSASQRVTRTGIIISLISGLLMGGFYPFLTAAMQTTALHGGQSLGPYSVAPWFALGVLLCALPLNAWLMRYPIGTEPQARIGEYFSAPVAWHVWGLIGGLIWTSGLVLNLVSSRAQFVGPAISYAIGQGATMISAAWGVFIWREFASAPPAAKRLILPMFVLFLIGLGLIALAPTLR